MEDQIASEYIEMRIWLPVPIQYKPIQYNTIQYNTIKIYLNTVKSFSTQKKTKTDLQDCRVGVDIDKHNHHL